MDISNARTASVILKAADLIHRQGFEATTVNEISKATGLTKGGLYHYITGKRDLLYLIMRFGMETLQQNVVARVRDIEDPEEQLRTLIRLHVELIATGRGTISILNEEVQGLEPKHRMGCDAGTVNPSIRWSAKKHVHPTREQWRIPRRRSHPRTSKGARALGPSKTRRRETHHRESRQHP